ncbi:hypothetical protein D3C80_1109310 [compost metagenome]
MSYLKKLFATVLILSTVYNPGQLVAQQTAKAASVQNYLSSPETIVIGGTNYHLSWSSNPAEGYYKQEYLPKGQDAEKFTDLLLVEAVNGELTIKQAADAQVQMLKERKATDPVVNYSIIENKDKTEIILDFLMSEGDIVEWNAYRYKMVDEKAVLLFGMSKRSYGDSTQFLTALKSDRATYIKQLATAEIPKVKVP